jgi:DNA-binding GntR family transcriptional regulator
MQNLHGLLEKSDERHVDLDNECIIDVMVKEFVHNTLLHLLREVLVSGEVGAGEKVPEAQLCERFGVSRTPMREALKVMAAEGHVDLLPNRGARMRALSFEEVEGLFAVTGAMEALAGEQACERVLPEEIARLSEMHEQMRNAYERRDRDVYYGLNRKIHEGIVAATRNPVLLNQYAMLNARLRRIRFDSPMTDEIWARAMSEHEGMLNALQRRDGAAMASILKTHLKHKSQAILAAMHEEAILAPTKRPRARALAKTS